jgi:hypothetical protein
MASVDYYREIMSRPPQVTASDVTPAGTVHEPVAPVM